MRNLLVDMMIKLQNFIDHEEVLKQLINFDKVGVIFQYLRDSRLEPDHLKVFVLEAFRYTMKLERFDLSIRLFNTYDTMLLKERVACNDILIASFARSPFMYEIKIYMLELFEQNFGYSNYDRLLTSIEGHFSSEEPGKQVISNCINSLVTSFVLIDLLYNIMEKHNVLEFRCNCLIELILMQCQCILVNLNMPKEIRAMVNQNAI